MLSTILAAKTSHLPLLVRLVEALNQYAIDGETETDHQFCTTA